MQDLNVYFYANNTKGRKEDLSNPLRSERPCREPSVNQRAGQSLTLWGLTRTSDRFCTSDGATLNVQIDWGMRGCRRAPEKGN